jgi:hypothetical protein
VGAVGEFECQSQRRRRLSAPISITPFQPAPEVSAHYVRHGLLANPIRSTNNRLILTPRTSLANSKNLALGQFAHSMSLTTVRYTVSHLVHLVITLRPPCKMRWVATGAIATKMPNLMLTTGARTMELLSDHSRRLGGSLLASPQADTPVTTLTAGT